ncbi:hypothetical protein HK101_005560 [Irineochytrium annulatum]|nr:hypothetical protein HK101_005560 [Irineochytrium annulatum]
MHPGFVFPAWPAPTANYAPANAPMPLPPPQSVPLAAGHDAGAPPCVDPPSAAGGAHHLGPAAAVVPPLPSVQIDDDFSELTPPVDLDADDGKTHWEKDKSPITGMSSLEALVAWLKDGNFARLMGTDDKTDGRRPHRKDNPTKATLFKECEEHFKVDHGLIRRASTIQGKFNTLLRSYRLARDVQFQTGEGLEDGDWDLMDDAEKDTWKENWLTRKRVRICKEYEIRRADLRRRHWLRLPTERRVSEALRTRPVPAKSEGEDTTTPLRRQSIAGNNDSSRTIKKARTSDGEKAKEKDGLAEVGAMLIAMREKEAGERVRLEARKLEMEERRLALMEEKDRALTEKECQREERHAAVEEGKLALMREVELRRAEAEAKKAEAEATKAEADRMRAATEVFKTLRDAGFTAEEAWAKAYPSK